MLLYYKTFYHESLQTLILTHFLYFVGNKPDINWKFTGIY